MKGIIIILILAGIVAAWCFTPAATSRKPVTRLSPPGVCYLRQYLSVTSRTGVVGWTPGKELRLDAQAPETPGQIAVTDGTNKVSLDASLLTRDMDEAAALRANDQQFQASSIAQLADANAALAARQHETFVTGAENINAESARIATASAIGSQASRLQEPTVDRGSSVVGAYYYGVPVYQNNGTNTVVIIQPAPAKVPSPLQTAAARVSNPNSAPAFSAAPRTAPRVSGVTGAAPPRYGTNASVNTGTGILAH